MVYMCAWSACTCSREGSMCGVSGTVEVCDGLVWYPLMCERP